MAETAVSFALDQVLQLLKEEATLLGGIHKGFADIKDELAIIAGILKDADRRAADEANSEEGVKAWVKQVRELSFRIEDAIAEYMYVAHRTQSHHHRCITFPQRISHFIRTLMPRHRLASEIQEIKSSILRVEAQSKSYNFRASLESGSSNSAKWHDPRIAFLFIDEAEVVGFEKPRDRLVHWLVDGAKARTVISVVGMGGCGKSTLAMNVFNNLKVKGHFDCRAFVTVSQTYTVEIESLWKNILSQFYEDGNKRLPQRIHTMDKISLVKEMRQYLQEKRYVIVFDDVWKEDFWEEIQHATLDNSMGSRIIITTRNLDVATYCKKSSLLLVHNLQPLPHNKAWELFCRKAFHFDFDGNCPPELKDMSNDVVKKCDGLPLAIVAIAGLLSTKEKTVFEWKKIYQNLSFEIKRNPHMDGLKRILALSYDDLPYYLKSCMLYFGIYPEDYSIRCTRLVRQWIAEGFVAHEDQQIVEEVAEQYLTELIHRSLVQVSKVGYDGKALSCRVHDLLREMIMEKMKDLSFCRVVRNNDQPTSDVSSPRRLAIATSSENVLGSITQHSHIQSMHVFEASELPDHFLKRFFERSKLLKVLDLEGQGASLTYVPNELGNIFHLKYLSLRNTKVQHIPESICKLQNLETLDLKQTLVQDLPTEINKLTKLRHLLVYYRGSSFRINGETGVRLNGSVGKLTSLQKLYHVEADHGGLSLIEELKKLRQLRKLGLKKVTREYGKSICEAIQVMDQLETFHVSAITEDEVLDLQSISSLPRLRRLHLFGRLENLPNWVAGLQYLVRLSIHYSKLKGDDDPLKSIKDLPNLLRLAICNDACAGEELHFKAGFQKLKSLYLVELSKVSSIIVDDGALQALELLQVTRMPQLKEMPSSLHLLKSLETLYSTDMPHEFNQSIYQEEGPMYWVIKHVRFVSIREKVEGGRKGYKFHTIRHPRDE